MSQLLFSGMVKNIEWRMLNGQRLPTIRAIVAGINLSNSLNFFHCQTLIIHLVLHLPLRMFLSLLPHAFDIAHPSSVQDVCHNKPIKNDLTRHESPSRSVVRASHQCAEGHRKPTHDT